MVDPAPKTVRLGDQAGTGLPGKSGGRRHGEHMGSKHSRGSGTNLYSVANSQRRFGADPGAAGFQRFGRGGLLEPLSKHVASGLSETSLGVSPDCCPAIGEATIGREVTTD